MKRIIVVAVLIACCAISARAQSAVSGVGTWEAELEVGQRSIPLVLHVERAGPDSLTAAMDSPKQNVRNMPAQQVVAQGDSLTMTFVPRMHGGKAPALTFTGAVRANPRTYEAKMEQRGRTFPVTFAPKATGGEAAQ